MKLLIEIPDEFREHFEFDRFQDSFMRICGDLEERKALSGRYEKELLGALKDAFKNAVGADVESFKITRKPTAEESKRLKEAFEKWDKRNVTFSTIDEVNK